MTLINYLTIGFVIALLALIEALRTPYKRKNLTDKNAKINSLRKIRTELKKNYSNEEKLIFTNNIQIPITDSPLVSNRFALLIAGSGSGKSDSVIKNNIIACPSADKLVTDVGGVLYDEFKGYLKNNDYKVSYLDLLNFEDTFQFNPLRYIRARGPKDTSFNHYIGDKKVGYDEELDIDFIDNVICKSLIPKNEKDDFWNQLTRDLLSLLIQILIYLPDEYYQKNRNMSTAVNLFSQIFEPGEPGEEENATKLDDIVSVLESELSDYVLGADGKRYLQLNMDLPASSVVLSYKAIRSQLSGSGDFASSMRGSFSTYLSIFNKPNIIRLTKSDNLGLDKLGTGEMKKAIFVQTNEAEDGYMQIVSLFYSVIFNLIIYNSTRSQSNRLDRNVLLILEEAGNYQIPNLAKILATTRKRGASAIIAIQSVSQLNELYGKNDTETIISNCAIKQYISGTTSTSNIELLQKLGGETKYQMEGLSSSNGRSSGRSLSETYHSLLTANYINSLPKFHSIVILGTDVYEDKNMYYKDMAEWQKYKHVLERRASDMDIREALEKKGITEDIIDDSDFGEPDSVDVITYDDIKDIVKGGVDHGENEQDKAGAD